MKLYVDGIQVPGAGSTTEDIYYYEMGHLYFAHYYSGTWLAYSGTIDEVGIWNRALTADEVAWLASPEVEIDIKPGSDPNCFNSDGHGVIPVAILGSADFDPSIVDPFTLTLDGAGVRLKGKSGNAGALDDVNGDGFDDLVVQMIDENVYSGDTTATLRGFTYSGLPIVGTDSICIVP